MTPATSEEDIHVETFDTPAPISATIEVGVGDVRINAGERAVSSVEVRPSDESRDEDVRAAQLTRVECANGQMLVRTPKPRSWSSRRDGGSVDVAIELPAGSQVRCHAHVANVTSEGQLGACRIRTGLGDIRLDTADTPSLRSGIGDISLDHATGNAEIATGSGELRLGRLDGSAVIKNSNGATWVGVAGGDVRLQAANGSIAVDLACAGVAAKSANGSVRLGEAVRGAVVLETHRGDLEIGIREGTTAWLDARTAVGTVRNALAAADAPARSSDAVEVRARTSIGDIVVRRP